MTIWGLSLSPIAKAQSPDRLAFDILECHIGSVFIFYWGGGRKKSMREGEGRLEVPSNEKMD